MKGRRIGVGGAHFGVLRGIVWELWVVGAALVVSSAGGEGDPPLQGLAVVGERNSGTNFVQTLLFRNFDLPVHEGVPCAQSGKHFFQRLDRCTAQGGGAVWNEPECGLFADWPTATPRPAACWGQPARAVPLNRTLILVVTKNAFDWVLSMHAHPYHAPRHAFDPANFSRFVRRPWTLIDTLDGDSGNGGGGETIPAQWDVERGLAHRLEHNPRDDPRRFTDDTWCTLPLRAEQEWQRWSFCRRPRERSSPAPPRNSLCGGVPHYELDPVRQRPLRNIVQLRNAKARHYADLVRGAVLHAELVHVERLLGAAVAPHTQPDTGSSSSSSSDSSSGGSSGSDVVAAWLIAMQRRWALPIKPEFPSLPPNRHVKSPGLKWDRPSFAANMYLSRWWARDNPALMKRIAIKDHMFILDQLDRATERAIDYEYPP